MGMVNSGVQVPDPWRLHPHGKPWNNTEPEFNHLLAQACKGREKEPIPVPVAVPQDEYRRTNPHGILDFNHYRYYGYPKRPEILKFSFTEEQWYRTVAHARRKQERRELFEEFMGVVELYSLAVVTGYGAAGLAAPTAGFAATGTTMVAGTTAASSIVPATAATVTTAAGTLIIVTPTE